MMPLISLRTKDPFFAPSTAVSKYEKGSEAKLNPAKSEAMWLGRWRANGACPFGLKWVNKFRILEVFFSNGLVDVKCDNWKAILDKLKQVLGLWSQRDLSFVGRGIIINLLAASRFWHLAKVLPAPNWVADGFKKIIWSFLRRSKSETVSRQLCCAPFPSGGLNTVDFKTKCASLRLSNFADYRDDFGTCKGKWHYLARYLLGNRMINLDKSLDFSSLRTADVSPRSSPLRDLSWRGASATQWQKFHTDDVNQCLHNISGSHGVPRPNLFNFTFLLVDFT